MSLLRAASVAVNNQLLDEAWDIILIAGQSNASGRGTPIDDPGLDSPDPRIHQWETQEAQTGGLSQAIEPLTARDGGGGVSFALTFAKQYLANRSTSQRKVVLVNGGDGGTTLVSGSTVDWSSSGQSYANMFTRITEAWTAAPAGSRIVCVLWSQGESDSQSSVTTADYNTNLGALIDAFRASEAGPAIPFVALGMVPSWVQSGRETIDESHQNVAALREYCAYVQGDDTGNINDIHYNPVQQRANGVNLFLALPNAELNTSANVGLPTTPTISSLVSPVAGEIVVSYTTTGPLESHKVQYKLQADSTWITSVEVAGDNHDDYTIQSLAAGDYDVRILSSNFVGDTASATSSISGVLSSGAAFMPFGNSDFGLSTDITGFTTTPDTLEARWRISFDDWDVGSDAYHWSSTPNGLGQEWAAFHPSLVKWRVRTKVNGTSAVDDAGSGHSTLAGIKTYRLVHDFTQATGPIISYYESVDNLTDLKDIVEEAGGWVEIGAADNFGESTQTVPGATRMAVGAPDDIGGQTHAGDFYQGAWYEDGVLQAEFKPPSAGLTTWTASTGETWTTDAATVS